MLLPLTETASSGANGDEKPHMNKTVIEIKKSEQLSLLNRVPEHLNYFIYICMCIYTDSNDK